MGGMLSVLPRLMEGMSARGVLMMLFWLFVICIACIVGGVGESNRGQEQYNRAVSLWISECGKPIEVCAYDWDRSYTLRTVYLSKARAIRSGEQQ